MCGGGHRRLGGNAGGAGIDQRRIDQWFVALHIDDHCIGRKAGSGGDFSNAVGTGGMVTTRQPRIDSVRVAGGQYISMVSRDNDLRRTG